MKASFKEISYHQDPPKIKGKKAVQLPFARVSARALIIRRSDGAVFGVRHRPGASMALPGGGLDNKENPAQALSRELEEENIQLINPDVDWQDRFGVDYYAGYRELNFWYLIAVDEVQATINDEIMEWSWVPQSENPWYPGMHTLLLHFIGKYLPEQINKSASE